MYHLLVQMLAAALLNALLPSCLVVGLAWATLSVRSWSAATRYVIWWVALAAVVAMTFEMPFAPAPGSPEPKPVPVVIRVSHTAPLSASPIVSPKLPPRIRVSAIVAAGCLCLVFVQLLRLGVSLLAIFRLKEGAHPWPYTPPQLKVRRNISFAASSSVSSPVAVGYLRPYVIVPSQLAAELTPFEMEHVVAHEIAHLDRYDDVAILIQRLIGVLFAFHPLVQLISWRMNLDREIACDDRVLSASRAADYAASLTNVAERVRFASRAALSLPFIGRKSNFARRIESMLDVTRSHRPALSFYRAASFAAVAGVVAVIALRTPSLIASPLSNGNPADIGPIVLTLPDGATATFSGDSDESRQESAFPRGTIVFKRDGKSYIIRDQQTIDESAALMKPMRGLQQRERELAGKEKVLSEQATIMAEKMEKLAQAKLDPATQRMIEERLREVEKQMSSPQMQKALESASRAADELAKVQDRLGELQDKLGEVENKLGDAQGELGEEQGKLGEEQGRLGELQSRPGERQATEAERIGRELQKLIQRAEKQGLAQPLQ